MKLPALEDEDLFINVEDYDEKIDVEFIDQILLPYLTDLFSDLMVRSNDKQALDKTTFTEYTQLPGIINDRLHYMFSNCKMKYDNDAGSSPK